jgi:hypothetical protein
LILEKSTAVGKSRALLSFPMAPKELTLLLHGTAICLQAIYCCLDLGWATVRPQFPIQIPGTDLKFWKKKYYSKISYR